MSLLNACNATLFLVTLVLPLNARDLGECETQIPTETFAWYCVVCILDGKQFPNVFFLVVLPGTQPPSGCRFRNPCVLRRLHYKTGIITLTFKEISVVTNSYNIVLLETPQASYH